ncbi:hypothetical protein PS938_05234 [Pseudomonas fluorescens]|uniref:Uncharacterized protein n=1 Tax=Pseudomonas fluorescens TaxID=294 RepID=A0A5E7VIP2_PSEFL|nr:hypothetical protein PS938_05234 [Pseudomonas fluorescens]
MLAYGYRVASNAVYGSSNIEKFTLGGGFLFFFMHVAMMSGCHYLSDLDDGSV